MSSGTDHLGDVYFIRAKVKAKVGVPCPACVKLLPKAHPTMLAPNRRCKIHGYTDPRPELSAEEINAILNEEGGSDGVA